MLETATNDNAASELVDIFSRCVEAGLQADASFAERERRALELSNELARRHMEAALQELATSEGSAVLVDGVEYRRHQMGRGSYHSLCGTLRVERWTYRCAGVRNGPTCVPLELRAGLVEGATPQLAFAVTQGYAKQPIRSVEQDLRVALRRPPSRSTLERMASRIGYETRKALVRLENRVRAAEELPAAAAGISLGWTARRFRWQRRLEATLRRRLVGNRRRGAHLLVDAYGIEWRTWTPFASQTRRANRWSPDVMPRRLMLGRRRCCDA
jgi:hypothetical protein